MAIPQYQEFMNPVLSAFGDEKQKNHAEVEKLVVTDLHISPEEQKQLLPSGTTNNT